MKFDLEAHARAIERDGGALAAPFFFQPTT